MTRKNCTVCEWQVSIALLSSLVKLSKASTIHLCVYFHLFLLLLLLLLFIKDVSMYLKQFRIFSVLHASKYAKLVRRCLVDWKRDKSGDTDLLVGHSSMSWAHKRDTDERKWHKHSAAVNMWHSCTKQVYMPACERNKLLLLVAPACVCSFCPGPFCPLISY